MTFDKKRQIGDGPVVFQTVRVKRWLFQKWFYNGLFENKGKDTSLQRLIDDGSHCRKQCLQAFSKEFPPLPKFPWPYFPSPQVPMAIFFLSPSSHGCISPLPKFPRHRSHGRISLLPYSHDTDFMALFPLSPRSPDTDFMAIFPLSPSSPDTDFMAQRLIIVPSISQYSVRSQARGTVTTEQTGLRAQCGTFCYSMHEIC